MLDQLLGPYLPAMLLTLGFGSAVVGGLVYVFSLQGAAKKRSAYGWWAVAAVLMVLGIVLR